jgi:hypothetical protein
MTNEELREIEINCNREDIPRLVERIRQLQFIVEQCREILR